MTIERELAINVMDVFEEFLASEGIVIPSDDRVGEEIYWSVMSNGC